MEDVCKHLKLRRVTIMKELNDLEKEGYPAVRLANLYPIIYELHGEITEELKDWEKLKELMAKKLLPEAFEREGIKNLKTLSGQKISISESVYANVSKENKFAAHEWLREHGHDDLIQETVNANSLRSRIKGLLEDGEDVPLDIFGVAIVPNTRLTKG